MSSILCIGNFGTGREEQYTVSELLCDLCKNDCKLILGLGNNIYPEGVDSKDDSLFIEKFEIPYHVISTDIKFYNILGNRDYNLKYSPQAQIDYTDKSFRWIMPHNFYCFMKKIGGTTVDFIAIDTNLDKIKNKHTQQKWAINTLIDSRARWRIVFGHHPWHCFGRNQLLAKEPYSKLDNLYQNLVDTGKVDLIISGHENSQQHIYIPGKPNLVISGVGGYSHIEKQTDSEKIYANELKFRSLELGCLKLNVSRNEMDIQFINIDKKMLYEFKIKKQN